MTTYSRALSFALMVLFVPAFASAASKPTCSLEITSPRGEVTTKKEAAIFAVKGETLTLAWESKNAKKAVDDERDEVELEDSMTVVAKRNETIGITFSNGSKKVECAVSIRIAEAGFDTASLATSDTKPTLSGDATGTKSVRIELRDAKGKKIFTSKETRVRKGEWEVDITKSLKAGKYAVTLLGDKKYDLASLATSTLTILPKGATQTRGGSVTVSQLALLMGGVATPGTSIAVAYVQVRNTGTASTTMNGIHLIETGSAPDDSVIGFSVNDDKGGSRATYGGTEGTSQFKNGRVFVPLPYTLKAGEVRIFTVKAIVSANKRLYGNQELRINVAGVDTSASISGMFPMVGTTWVLR